MTLQQFEALELKKGMGMSVVFYPRGNRKIKPINTGHVEYKGDGKGYQHTFSSNNLANDFYSLWINEIETVNIFK